MMAKQHLLAFVVVVALCFGARAQPFVQNDVRNFGAVCDSPSAQAANNAAILSAIVSAGGAYIPACVIYISNVSLPNGAHVYGSGAASILAASGVVSGTGLLNCHGCNLGIGVRSLQIQTTPAQRAAGLSGVTCENCSNVSIIDNVISGNYGVALQATANSSVSQNTISGYGEAAGSNISGAGIAVIGTSLDGFGYNCGGASSSGVTISENVITNSAQGTSAGIIVCQSQYTKIVGNTLLTPGYFGIVEKGNVTGTLASQNTIVNSVHEGIIFSGGTNFTAANDNLLQFGPLSIDYGITIDGSEGRVNQVEVGNNVLLGCYVSCIAVLGDTHFSLVSGNNIVNPNASSTPGEAGISVWGENVTTNMFVGNMVTSTFNHVGYIIHEFSAGGQPSHNVYTGNSGNGMATGTFVIGAASQSSNNTVF
jgi:hypothetical protein